MKIKNSLEIFSDLIVLLDSSNNEFPGQLRGEIRAVVEKGVFDAQMFISNPFYLEQPTMVLGRINFDDFVKSAKTFRQFADEIEKIANAAKEVMEKDIKDNKQ